MTLSEFYKKYNNNFNRIIKQALDEDSIKKDISTNLALNLAQRSRVHTAILLCKEDCIAAGTDIFIKVFKLACKNTKIKKYFKDGNRIKKNSVVLEIQAPLGILLSCERTALNIIQRMSGVATLTDKFVQMLKYKHSKILHTRKTTPNFRLFELAAVKTGGGEFYRESLESSVMIKDNHIEAAGSVTNALKRVRAGRNRVKHFTTIEVKDLNQVNTVCKEGKGVVNRVMLDNFSRKLLSNASKRLKSAGFETELSGGLNLKNFPLLQYPEIDYYSIGCITHSYKSIDFSFEF